MRTLIIADVHANFNALSVLPAAELFICAGDIVSFGPAPSECVNWMWRAGAVCVRGDEDDAVAHFVEQALPEHLCHAGTASRARVSVVHAYPGDYNRYLRPTDDNVQDAISRLLDPGLDVAAAQECATELQSGSRRPSERLAPANHLASAQYHMRAIGRWWRKSRQVPQAPFGIESGDVIALRERCAELEERLHWCDQQLRERSEKLYELQRTYSTEHFSLAESVQELKKERLRNAGAYAGLDNVLERARQLQSRIYDLKTRLRAYETVEDLHFDSDPILIE